MRSEPCIRCGMPTRRGTYCLPCETKAEAAKAAKADTRETIHIISDDLVTQCGLAWAINMIGCCRVHRVEEYRARPDCRICPTCETRLAEKRARRAPVAEGGTYAAYAAGTDRDPRD